MTQLLAFCRFSVGIVPACGGAVCVVVRAVLLSSLCALREQLVSDLSARPAGAITSPTGHATNTASSDLSSVSPGKASVFVTGCILPPHPNQALS